MMLVNIYDIFFFCKVTDTQGRLLVKLRHLVNTMHTKNLEFDIDIVSWANIFECNQELASKE